MAVKNKKATTVKGVQRPMTISVVMMKEYCPLVPKNKARQKLSSEGRILSIKVTRGMSNQEIKNLIMRTFQITEYTVLECDDTGHNLLRRIDQSIDGSDVMDLRGALYLCEVYKVQKVFKPHHSHVKPQGVSQRSSTTTHNSLGTASVSHSRVEDDSSSSDFELPPPPKRHRRRKPITSLTKVRRYNNATTTIIIHLAVICICCCS